MKLDLYKKAAVLLLLAGVALIILGWSIKAIEGLCYAFSALPFGLAVVFFFKKPEEDKTNSGKNEAITPCENIGKREGGVEIAPNGFKIQDGKKKIFVSFTSKDRDWAEWIAVQLERQEEYEVIIQSWDFAPGDNFVLKMDEALQTSEMVVAVLSRAYLESYYCQYELSAAFTDKDKRLIPVRVDDLEVKGLWAPINYIDLVGKSEEDAQSLLARIFKKPPRISKGFPGNKTGSAETTSLWNTTGMR